MRGPAVARPAVLAIAKTSPALRKIDVGPYSGEQACCNGDVGIIK